LPALPIRQKELLPALRMQIKVALEFEMHYQSPQSLATRHGIQDANGYLSDERLRHNSKCVLNNIW
jgi:hypothetical protein